MRVQIIKYLVLSSTFQWCRFLSSKNGSYLWRVVGVIMLFSLCFIKSVAGIRKCNYFAIDNYRTFWTEISFENELQKKLPPKIKLTRARVRQKQRFENAGRSTFVLPCEQLVSPMLPESRETTASNRLIFHRACAKYLTPHVMLLTSLLFSRDKYRITKQQAHPNAAVT